MGSLTGNLMVDLLLMFVSAFLVVLMLYGMEAIHTLIRRWWW